MESSGTDWTIQRATQFFDLIDQFLQYGLFLRTRNLHFQPVGAVDVAERLANLVAAGPSGRMDDAGGPEIVSLRELAATPLPRQSVRSAHLDGVAPVFQRPLT